MSFNAALALEPRLVDIGAETGRSGAPTRELAESGGVDLATDRRRLPGAGYRGALESIALHDGCRDLGPETFAYLLSAWYAVLHRHTGQSDLLVGSRYGLGGPSGAETETGERASPVVSLRIVFDPSAPFADLVDRTRECVLEAVRRVDEPDATGPADFERCAGSAVRIGFGLLPSDAADGLPSDPAVDRAPFDAELIVAIDDSEAVASLRYDALLFSQQTAQRLLRHYVAIVAAVRSAPGSPVRRLPVGEQAEPRPEWTLPAPEGFVPPRPAEPSETLVDRFRETVAAHGQRSAVSGRSGHYSYAELYQTSSALAGRLARHAPAGSRIALLCAHDTHFAIGIWSVLMADCAYVPLDPRQPNGRLSRILADAKVSAVLCDPGLAARAAVLAKGAQVVAIPRASDEASAAAPALIRSASIRSGDADTTQSPDRDAADETIAYLLHTSGSTGRPKAVVQTRRNVLDHALTYADRLRIGPGDRLPLLARYTFDAAVMDFFGALLTGASLTIVDPLQPSGQLWSALAGSAATVLHCTPTLFRHLLSAADAPDAAPWTQVRAVVLGGEEVRADDLIRFERCFPEGCALVNGLGPTECTLALQHLARRGDAAETASVPVGHPVGGVDVRLLDDDGLPTEVLGEIELRGPRLALGYWRQPEATAAAFGVGSDGTRFYRTGDLARRTADGGLVYLGRKDRQVKIRGHRIEPGEIEAVLRAHPTVAQAAVVPDRYQNEARLLAYATSATSVPLDPAELMGYLERQLPDYEVPALILPLDALPLGPTGKLDRSRLPAATQAPETTPADEASGPVQSAVARIWCRVLRLDTVGAQANFMASGGDSLRMMEMLAAVHEEFGVQIPLAGFLRSPTIAAIAQFVERGRQR